MKKSYIIAAVLIMISVVIGGCGFFGGESVSDKYADKASELGYSLEASGNEYVVEDGNTKYYYKKGLFKLKFTKYEVTLDDDVEPNGVITATMRSSKKVDVSMKSDRGYVSFFCGTDFSDSMFSGSEFKDPLGKRKESYEDITGVMSSSELRHTYEKAMDICDELND